MEESIFVMRKDGPNPMKDDVTNVIGYTGGLRPDDEPMEIDPDDDECYCKTVSFQSKRNKFYVKINVNGFVYDPWANALDLGRYRYTQQTGKKLWNFHEVTEAVFNNYLSFLRTRNRIYKIQIEREIVSNAQTKTHRG